MQEHVIPITDEDRRLELLDDEECTGLLAKTATGRLGFTHGALPAILPVAYAVHDGHVLVPARQGSDVVRAVRGSVVAFQVDEWAAEDRIGWSVTLVGPVRLITTAGEVRRLEELCPTTRPPAPDRCYIAVRAAVLQGWRMTHRAEDPRS